MKVVTQTHVTAIVAGGFGEKGDDAKAIQLIADAGFDGFDMGLDRPLDSSVTPWKIMMDRPNYREYAIHLRNVADAIGFPCLTAHAPCFACGHPEGSLEFQQLIRGLEAASILGAKAAVVHIFDNFPGVSYSTDRKGLFRQLKAWLRTVLPYAKKFGVKIAMENMAIELLKIPEDYCELIDDVDPEWICACVDLGHAAIGKSDIPSLLRGLGKDRLYMMHVHDNTLVKDDHLIPFMGKMDYPAIIQALKDIRFDGVIHMECSTPLFKFPPELTPQVLQFTNAVGRYLQQKISE